MGYMPVIWLVIGVLWWTNGCLGLNMGYRPVILLVTMCVMVDQWMYRV